MIPVGHPETKVYWQLKTVKYADYKVGKFYVSPALFKDFKDPEALFSYEELWWEIVHVAVIVEV